ncbi:APC family permease [Stygiolobus caldivivus]|uniref:Amino acid permease n=1 Tax=Stygiolobus caldivivus TaxID=2824673 RepID=A0A8D5U505_9CREN|nr:APC family permease [Stygiolobus caldivivus]BCU69378.1 amino acid permease [Stygiolobus caldivivus]
MGLSKASLSLREAYGQAMAVTAPLGSVVSTTTAAIAYAGRSVVFATILALIGSALWVYTLTRYSSKLASAGGFYTYGAAAWRRKTVAYYEAIFEIIAYSSLNAVNAFTIYLILQTILQQLNISLPSYALILTILLGLAYPTLASYLIHIRRLLSYIVSVSATLEVLFLFALFIYAVATKGFNPTYFIPSSHTSIGAIGTAMILSIVSISGAGAATYLGEETKTPTKNITAGIWLSLILGGGAILAGTYGLVALWNGSLSSLSNCAQPLLYELFRFGLPIVMLGLLMSVNSLLASNIGTTVGAARVLFNLAREKVMPNIFEKINKENEPIVATMAVGIISALFTIIPLVITGSVENAFTEISVITSIFWLTGRIIDGFGVPVLYWVIGRLSISSAVIPIASGLINLVGIGLSIQLPDMFQTITVIVILLLATMWYIVKGRFGKPGTLVVDENNEVITIDEYLKRYKQTARAS